MFLSSLFLLIFSFNLIAMAIFLLMNSMFITLNIPIIHIMNFQIPISILIDWMSISFLSTVMFISSFILMFSVSYIPKKDHLRFSILLILFVLSMSLLILSDNLIFILLGWDGLGFSSYILVIFYQNFSTAASGSITIFSNRIGDIMILLSISLLMSLSDWNFFMNENYPLLPLILLTTAACSKSAQFPFSAWLPEAMAAPTPISALVHSSTLVTAGIYLLIRILNNPHPNILLLIMLISTITTLMSSLSANWEQDMKKIIALSTLSQIAIMLFAISLSSINITFFHLISHALFKSTMFLCAGIIIHSSSYQDMRSMGSMLNKFPLVLCMLGISNLTLMGLPFTSGFFSKDIIIENLLSLKYFSFLSILMTLSIGLTAAYSIRMTMLSTKFLMKCKPDINIHSSNYMDFPILIMSFTSILLGASLHWMICPEQMFILPHSIKLMIIFTLMLGFIMGLSLSFFKKKFLKLGFPLISLWFMNPISTNFLSPSMLLSNQFSKNDLSWQEMYGAIELSTKFNNLSSLISILSITSLMSLLIISLMPLFLIT